MKELNFKAVQHVNEKVQAIDPAWLAQSPHECNQTIIWAATQRAFCGEQQAIAKKDWMDAKAKAYASFDLNDKVNKERVEKYGKTNIKDYIAAKCGDLEARYEYIERTTAALDSAIKAITMVISSLKQEMSQGKYVT